MNPLFTKFFGNFTSGVRKQREVFIESKKRLSKNKFKYLLWLLKETKNSRFAVKKVKKRWLFYKPKYIAIFLKSSKKPRWAIIGFSFILVSILGTILVMVSFPLLKELKFHRSRKPLERPFKMVIIPPLYSQHRLVIIKPDKIESLERLVAAAEKLKHPRLWEWGKKLSEHPLVQEQQGRMDRALHKF